MVLKNSNNNKNKKQLGQSLKTVFSAVTKSGLRSTPLNCVWSLYVKIIIISFCYLSVEEGGKDDLLINSVQHTVA